MHNRTETEPRKIPPLNPRPTATVVAAALAVLNRHAPGTFTLARGCPCFLCDAARHTPFDCAVCGYHGTPFVGACSCPEDIDAIERGEMAKLQKGVDDGMIAPKSYAGQWIQVLARRIEDRHERGTHQCIGFVAGDRYNDCRHGSPECPVCLGGPDAIESPEWFDPMAMIRDARAALAGSIGWTDILLPLVAFVLTQRARDHATPTSIRAAAVMLGQLADEIGEPRSDE